MQMIDSCDSFIKLNFEFRSKQTKQSRKANTSSNTNECRTITISDITYGVIFDRRHVILRRGLQTFL